jgi:hypothetical protein
MSVKDGRCEFCKHQYSQHIAYGEIALCDACACVYQRVQVSAKYKLIQIREPRKP